MQIFKLPDLGEGLPDAEIHEWHVAIGDDVEIDQPLVSMETAKAVVDVPTPQAGKVLTLYGQPGDVIKTGQPLVAFTSTETAVKTKHESSATSQDQATVVGNLATSEIIEQERFIIGSAAKSTERLVKATPAVRALAKELGIELTQITPQRADGMITAADLGAPSHTKTKQAQPEKLHGVRKYMAITMANAHQSVALVTLQDIADISAWSKEADFTLRLIQAINTACQTEPALNAWYDEKNMTRQLHQDVHLGIAIDSKEGLFVPVLRNTNQESAKSLRNTINQYKQQIADRSIPAERLKGASISLSNFGSIAGRYATPIVVPPTVAILGVGKAYSSPHPTLPLSLSFDHRAVTGGEAARFLATVIEELRQK